MAKREVLGKMACPECGFPDAEVKPQKNPELAYRWCPDCNAQYFPRTPDTSARLLAKVGKTGTPEHVEPIEQKEPEKPASHQNNGSTIPPEQPKKQPPIRRPGIGGALELLGVK